MVSLDNTRGEVSRGGLYKILEAGMTGDLEAFEKCYIERRSDILAHVGMLSHLLHSSLFLGRPDIAQFLLDEGASGIEEISREGATSANTAFDLAIDGYKASADNQALANAYIISAIKISTQDTGMIKTITSLIPEIADNEEIMSALGKSYTHLASLASSKVASAGRSK